MEQDNAREFFRRKMTLTRFPYYTLVTQKNGLANTAIGCKKLTNIDK